MAGNMSSDFTAWANAPTPRRDSQTHKRGKTAPTPGCVAPSWLAVNDGTADEYTPPVWPLRSVGAEPAVRWPPKDGQPALTLQETFARRAGSPAAKGRTARANATRVLFNALKPRAGLGSDGSMDLGIEVRFHIR
jgi:hypothetical protein